MTEQAIEAIRQLAVNAAPVQVLAAAPEPPSTYYLVEDGRAVKVRAEPPPRAHQARDLATLVGCAVRLANDPIPAPATIWCGRAGVTVLFDDDDRRDRMTLPLALSPQMKLLEDWSKALCWLDQASLIRTLRTTLARSVRGTNFVELFRRLKFSLNSQGENVVEHGRASVGKSIEAQVQGTAAIPETILIREPAFNGSALGVWCEVPCAIELNAATGTVAIVPLAGAVEEALLLAESTLTEKVRQELVAQGDGGEFVHVYTGTP